MAMTALYRARATKCQRPPTGTPVPAGQTAACQSLYADDYEQTSTAHAARCHTPRLLFGNRMRAPRRGRRACHRTIVCDLRERPGPPAGAVAGRHPAVRGQHAGQPARDLRRRRRRPAPRRLGAGRPRAGRRRRAHDTRGLGRQPPLRQRQHRRRRQRPARASCARCSSATSRATSSSRAPAATAPSSPPRTAARTAAVRPATHDAERRARRRLGVRRHHLGATLGGSR